MNKISRFARKAFVCLLALGLGMIGTTVLSAPAKAAELTVSDCVKCHEKEPAEIAANGMAHKSQIDCQACHESHRPKVANNVPQCSQCHDGEAHFKLEGCKNCHNPHSPLDISLEGELKEVCLTCHAEQGQEMASNPSMHAEVACNFCHADKHGVIPECVQCHEPHSSNMTQSDCGTCHQAHKPLALNYGPQTPSVQCAACHETAFNLLMDSKTKHHDLACAFCHEGKHKVVPQCSDCHGKPHAEGMHKKFPQCGNCHNIAHDLNQWTSTAKGNKK